VIRGGNSAGSNRSTVIELASPLVVTAPGAKLAVVMRVVIELPCQ